VTYQHREIIQSILSLELNGNGSDIPEENLKRFNIQNKNLTRNQKMSNSNVNDKVIFGVSFHSTGVDDMWMNTKTNWFEFKKSQTKQPSKQTKEIKTK